MRGDLILLGQLHHLREGGQLVAAGDNHRRRHLAEQMVQRLIPPLRALHREEIHLGQAHNLEPQVVKIFIITRQEQARAVDLGDFHVDFAQLSRAVNHFHIDPLSQFGQ